MADVAVIAERVSKTYQLGTAVAVNRLSEVLQYGAARLVTLGRYRPPGVPAGRTLEALKDVSFEIRQGETVGIIGHNGAGKSTLLKILSRIVRPTSGRVGLAGRAGSLLEVGTGFHHELTGRENIYLNGAILGMSRSQVRARLDEIVEFSGVEASLDTPVKRYSSGMAVRLAFSIAAHLEPEILIIDEVLAVGDAVFQKKCLARISEFTSGGRTVLFVSHNVKAVRQLCSRVLQLDHGRLVQDGDAESVIAAYLAGQGGSQLERRWDEAEAPGDDRVKLLAVCIDVEDEEAITVDSPLALHVLLDVRQPESLLHVNAQLFDAEQSIRFQTYSTPQAFEPGRVQLGCQIPGGLLNDGLHAIRLIVARQYRYAIAVEESAVRFTVTEAGNDAGYLGPIPGAVRPRLKWEVVSAESWPSE